MATQTFTPDRLIAGGFPIITKGDEVQLTTQVLVRGSLMGKITSGGKLKLCDSTSSDGSEDPYAVLAQNIDSTGGDVSAVGVYLSGEFNVNKLVFGGTDVAADHIVAMRALNMYQVVPENA